MTVTCYPSLNYGGKEERGTESLFFSVKGGGGGGGRGRIESAFI